MGVSKLYGNSRRDIKKKSIKKNITAVMQL